jgi:salicylate hydroxylase
MRRVAIIGGGIGGLTAANALSRTGIEVAVYEAAAGLKEIGAGVALHPNAMKVLRAIGVEDNVRKVAGRSHWQFIRNWKTGRVIAKTSRQQQAASFGTEAATVHRADLLDVLAGALAADVVTLGRWARRSPSNRGGVAPPVPAAPAGSPYSRVDRPLPAAWEGK